jgi:hypothetical protein
MSADPSPQKGSPADESGAKGLANLSKPYHQSLEGQVFSVHGGVLIRPCPESGKGVHDWIPHAARKLAIAGVDPCEAENWITARMTRTPSPSNEVAGTIAKIYREQSAGEKWSGIRGIEKPEFCPAKLQRIAAVMDGVDAEWLAARSPVPPHDCSPASFLHALFRKDEHVIVFTKFRSQGQMVWTHPGLAYDERALDQFRARRP